MIELQNITKIYESKKKEKTIALDNISLKIGNKGMVFIVGKSGSGKSTLLNVIGGLDKYNSGDLLINGKSTKNFKSKDFDFYRNTYVGFIFQEFNILEEYNVYQNISLAMKLQHKKVSKEKLNQLLNIVGMQDLGDRKINELSGGQKQRVAIARAIVKSPDIILADEPTGNLDKNTSEQIFELLKNLSQEKLVVVISHDIESAQKYADRIIEISDGKVINDTNPNTINTGEPFKVVKSFLPFIEAIKLAFSNLRFKRLRLFFTILLTALALIFFGLSQTLTKFNIPYSHAETMINENESSIKVSKNLSKNEFDGKYYDSGQKYAFNNSDITFIEKELEYETNKAYVLFENNEQLKFNVDLSGVKGKDGLNAYYTFMLNDMQFVELKNQDFTKMHVIGKIPTNNNEIMIHKYLADYFMKLGVMIVDNSNNEYKTEYYKPESYEQIISDQKMIKLGSNKVKIVGIIADNLNKYQYLKDLSIQQITSSTNNYFSSREQYKYNEFNYKIQDQAKIIYVPAGFVDGLSLEENDTIDSDKYSITVFINGNEHYTNSDVGYLHSKISISDGKITKEINNLKESEVVINTTYLDAVSDNQYSKLLDDYKKKYNESNKNNEGNEEVILSDKELTTKFTNNYLIENNIIGSKISLVLKSNEKNEESKDYRYDNLEIIGLAVNNDQNKVYFSKDLIENNVKPRSEIIYLYFTENNLNKLENIFNEFPIDGTTKFISHTVYSNTINSVVLVLSTIKNVAFYSSIVFSVFAMLLLINFITVSITYSKKQIGILRAIGARRKDVFKIFLYEGYMIGLISIILAVIGIIIICSTTNSYIINRLFFNIKFIIFTKEVALLLLISVLIVIFIASLFIVNKISKMKPIDAILNK